MDMGIGGSSGASWAFDIKKRACLQELNGDALPDLSFIYLGFEVGDCNCPTVK
jgi:hypothetical protein